MERYEYAAAVKAFEQALQAAPDSVEVRVNLALATFNRAAKGDLERAEQLLDDILHDQPDNVRALYFRGITHMYSGRDAEAVPLFEQVLKRAPRDATTWYLLARGKAHLDQPYRAELERAVELNPALASAYYDLMRLAVREGDQEQAQVYQQMFVQLHQSTLNEMVVMPHYREMGPLAVVQPLTGKPKRSVAGGELKPGPARTIFEAMATKPARGSAEKKQFPGESDLIAEHGVQLALADANGDGLSDLVVTAAAENEHRGVRLLLRRPDGNFEDATERSGMTNVPGAVSFAFGDYDNDNIVDLFICCHGPNRLFHGRGDGTFADVTERTKTAGPDVLSVSAVFLDADHDADLDLYVCNAASAGGSSAAANQLLNNNADGTFTDIATTAGVACPADRSIALAPADLDGDRDTDLVVFNRGTPARVFCNDRLGKYHKVQITPEPIRGDCGGLAQDFNGDERVDLLLFPGPDHSGQLLLTDGTGQLMPSPQYAECIKAISSWDDLRNTRVADVDLDGDLDVILFGRDGHVLFNDGAGRFVAKPRVWSSPPNQDVVAIELTDMTGDGVPDVLRVCSNTGFSIELVPTELIPPANWLAVTPTGDRGDDQRTRSPASGYGTRLQLRCGLHSQTITYTGLNGGLCQSHLPQIFGLNGATKADYFALRWPDGVTQCENELAAGAQHRIRETQRRISSCPVLFAWNGERFGFLCDFAGVGGLGYFVAPGQYADPQACEHVKIEPEQLVPKDGFYEVRVCEPMEEVAYVDRLELIAVDHPPELRVYPDERLAITGPPPTHRLLCLAAPIFPVQAIAPDGSDCVEQLTHVDRVYAYQPELDPRFVGFCRPHTLVLDFADLGMRITKPFVSPTAKAMGHPDESIYLFVNGWIEYPYSQTTFAASQAGVTWQPMKIERRTSDGHWEVIVPDAGAPGGLGRMIAVDLTGKLPDGPCQLRITTNLEIYYDQMFIAADRGTDGLLIRSVPLAGAELRRLGFPLEYSPDGRHPTIYSYDIIAPTSSFKMLGGAYTRYGPVESLLAEFDDRYVILGSGDEIAVSFDARRLPPPAVGHVRSFILVSHAYCKDMDLYTATPDTIAPLPFREMSRYPYPAGEHYPDGEDHQLYQERFNTRLAN
ncbi:MAG: VCBS repeat-containing protein [Phycisphaerae bacterium]|nr:VCBS repeat-containing protein [Phycisphaerae bacterium]